MLVTATFALLASFQAPYDLVIQGGRVMDPETGLDAVMNVGIRGGSIVRLSTERLRGARTIDARGLIVAPGFIDLHSHGQDAENYRLKALDGVTTALEMEIGVPDVASFLAERRGRALVHFGAQPIRSRLRGRPSSRITRAEREAIGIAWAHGTRTSRMERSASPAPRATRTSPDSKSGSSPWTVLREGEGAAGPVRCCANTGPASAGPESPTSPSSRASPRLRRERAGIQHRVCGRSDCSLGCERGFPSHRSYQQQRPQGRAGMPPARRRSAGARVGRDYRGVSLHCRHDCRQFRNF